MILAANIIKKCLTGKNNFNAKDMIYKVKVIETLCKTLEIEAGSPCEAKEQAEKLWLADAIDFDITNDHESHEIYLIGSYGY